MILKVNPKFKNLFAPLPKEAFAGLEQDILATNGPREPIVIWNGTIVDGHHRYEICLKHGLPFTTREESFSSEVEAIAWMIKEQFNRRNMSPVARTIAALNAKEALIEVGRQKQSLRKDLADFAAQPHNTRKLIAEKAGVSDTFVYQVDYVLQNGEAKLKEAMISEEMSVGQAYSIARKADERLELKKQKREEARQAVTPSDTLITNADIQSDLEPGIDEQHIPSDWTEFRRLSPEEQKSIRRAAQFANKSPEEVARVKRLTNEADEETLAKLYRDEISIDAAYEALASKSIISQRAKMSMDSDATSTPVETVAYPDDEVASETTGEVPSKTISQSLGEDISDSSGEATTQSTDEEDSDEDDDYYIPNRFEGMLHCDYCQRHVDPYKLVTLKRNERRGKLTLCPECADNFTDRDNPQNYVAFVRNQCFARLEDFLVWITDKMNESWALKLQPTDAEMLKESIRNTADEAIRLINMRSH